MAEFINRKGFLMTAKTYSVDDDSPDALVEEMSEVADEHDVSGLLWRFADEVFLSCYLDGLQAGSKFSKALTVKTIEILETAIDIGLAYAVPTPNLSRMKFEIKKSRRLVNRTVPRMETLLRVASLSVYEWKLINSLPSTRRPEDWVEAATLLDVAAAMSLDEDVAAATNLDDGVLELGILRGDAKKLRDDKRWKTTEPKLTVVGSKRYKGLGRSFNLHPISELEGKLKKTEKISDALNPDFSTRIRRLSTKVRLPSKST